MRSFDFSSRQAVLSTLTGLATVIGVGVRLLIMATIQQRRERENRQINERLRTLIAAYKTLGGSFTGDLLVDPTHLRDEQRRAVNTAFDAQADVSGLVSIQGSERARRVRDAVEAALSDIILLGTDDHVRLASRAARDLIQGNVCTRPNWSCRCGISSEARWVSTLSHPGLRYRCRAQRERRPPAAKARARPKAMADKAEEEVAAVVAAAAVLEWEWAALA